MMLGWKSESGERSPGKKSSFTAWRNACFQTWSLVNACKVETKTDRLLVFHWPLGIWSL
jgi:hypothetical protein